MKWLVLIISASGLSQVIQRAYADANISCNATASGVSATVTCHFGVDIKVLKEDFSVKHRSPNSSDYIPVSMCIWRDKIECNRNPGYTFDDTHLSDQLVVTIPNATSRDHDGEYTCVLASNGAKPVPCTLNIAGVPHPPSHVSVLNTTMESIRFCWKAPNGRVQTEISHRVRVRPTMLPVNYTTSDICPQSANCFTIAGLRPGTEYEISVLAFNKFGDSIYHQPPLIVNTSSIPQVEGMNIARTGDEVNIPAIVLGGVLAVVVAVSVTTTYCVWRHFRRKLDRQSIRSRPDKPDPCTDGQREYENQPLNPGDGVSVAGKVATENDSGHDETQEPEDIAMDKTQEPEDIAMDKTQEPEDTAMDKMQENRVL